MNCHKSSSMMADCVSPALQGGAQAGAQAGALVGKFPPYPSNAVLQFGAWQQSVHGFC